MRIKQVLDTNIENKVQEWLSDSYDENTHNEINRLIKEKNELELIDRFYKELEFGTGGLRGVIGAGTNRMNIYTVGKAAQGLANYLSKNEPDAGRKGVVIAYDPRVMSDVFSLRSALILCANGIKCYLFNSLHPTPILSFAIRYLDTIAGIVVTASHNPPEYNGYKVYYSDGGQVLPPHDKGILEEIEMICSVKEIKLISKEEALEKGLLNYIGEEVDEAYYEKTLSLSINPEIIAETEDNLKIVFTPIHGTGNIPVREALRRWGFRDVAVVKEQEKPDGQFPTVQYPNPEESDALTLAINQAKATKSDLVLATDPDCDRVGIAVNNGKNDFILLNGNQVGVFLTHYILSQYQKKNKLPKKGFVVKTIVTTDLVDSICDEFQVDLEEVLTGFKYIAQKVCQYHDQKDKVKEFLIGFEESYGYLVGDFVRDKDGVTACCLISEVAAVCKKEGKTILDYLDEIYQKYGFYLESLETITLKGKKGLEQIQKLMNYFRSSPPKSINGSSVVKIRDVELGKSLDLVENIENKLDLPKSNVLTYYLENGGKVTLRPSGTEPKVKFYFSCSLKEDEQTLSNIKQSVRKELDKLTNSFMKLVKNQLEIENKDS